MYTESWKIFEVITGSRLYGVSVPESDYDYRGVCVPPQEVLMDPFYRFEQKEFSNEDRTIYSLGKFFKLCAAANPNIIEMLFVPEQNVVMKTTAWDLVIENRHLFLSKKARFTFYGYAQSQLQRIDRHRRWFQQPPETPQRSHYDLPNEPVINLGVLRNHPHLVSLDYIKEDVREMLRRELAYMKAMGHWRHYQAWVRGRNPKRKLLEEEYGYDTKAASHLFRLLTECEELLLTGLITFPLKNADKILAIKTGSYTYEEIMQMADSHKENFDQLYKESSLPRKANMAGIKQLYFDIVKQQK